VLGHFFLRALIIGGTRQREGMRFAVMCSCKALPNSLAASTPAEGHGTGNSLSGEPIVAGHTTGRHQTRAAHQPIRPEDDRPQAYRRGIHPPEPNASDALPCTKQRAQRTNHSYAGRSAEGHQDGGFHPPGKKNSPPPTPLIPKPSPGKTERSRSARSLPPSRPKAPAADFNGNPCTLC